MVCVSDTTTFDMISYRNECLCYVRVLLRITMKSGTKIAFYFEREREKRKQSRSFSIVIIFHIFNVRKCYTQFVLHSKQKAGGRK